MEKSRKNQKQNKLMKNSKKQIKQPFTPNKIEKNLFKADLFAEQLGQQWVDQFVDVVDELF